MPRRHAPRVCPTPGCPNDQPCRTHARKPWTGTNRTNRTSTTGWRTKRRRILARDRYTCYQCGQHADQVDHLTPVAEGGTDDPANLGAICGTCHDRKTKAEAARGRARARRSA